MFSSATVIGWNAAVESGLVCNWTEAIEFTDINSFINISNNPTSMKANQQNAHAHPGGN